MSYDKFEDSFVKLSPFFEHTLLYRIPLLLDLINIPLKCVRQFLSVCLKNIKQVSTRLIYLYTCFNSYVLTRRSLKSNALLI